MSVLIIAYIPLDTADFNSSCQKAGHTAKRTTVQYSTAEFLSLLQIAKQQNNVHHVIVSAWVTLH